MLLHKILLVLVLVHVHLVAGSIISLGRVLRLQKEKPKTMEEKIDILLGPKPRKQPLTWTHRDLLSVMSSRTPPLKPPRKFENDLKNTTFTSTETPQIPPPVPPRKPAQNRTTLDSEEMVLRPIMPRPHWKPTLPLPMLESQSTRNADPQLKAKCDKQCPDMPGQQPQCMIVCLNGGIKRVVLRRIPDKIIFN